MWARPLTLWLDPLTQVDQWLDFLPALAAGPGFPAACAYVDSYLALRTTLVGQQLSVADLLLWGHLKSTRGCLTPMPKLRIETFGFGPARQKMALE